MRTDLQRPSGSSPPKYLSREKPFHPPSCRRRSSPKPHKEPKRGEKIKTKDGAGTMKHKLKKFLLPNLPYLLFVYLFAKLGQAYGWRRALTLRKSCSTYGRHLCRLCQPAPSLHPFDMCVGICRGGGCPADRVLQGQERQEVPQGRGIRFCPVGHGRRILRPT